jgi:hypothetical protein
LKDLFVEIAADKSFEVRLNRTRCFLGTDQCSSASIIRQIEKYSITDVVLHGHDYKKFDYDDLQILINWSQSHDVRINFIGPIPTYNISIPKALYDAHHKRGELFERISKQQFEDSLPSRYLKFERDNLSQRNIFFYRPEIYFCQETCKLEDSERVFYFDSNHLTLSGTKLLTPIVHDIYGKEGFFHP